MTKAELMEAVSKAGMVPHKEVHKGELIISSLAFQTPGKETNLCIHPLSLLDLTGSIHIGPWCMFGARARIYTHDHIHAGKSPLLSLQEKYGVLWQDKYIGSDVWLHDDAIVLYQVTHIPDGVVVGAGSVLTKNPGPYEIWAGVPAQKIGVRDDTGDQAIEEIAGIEKFSLQEYL